MTFNLCMFAPRIMTQSASYPRIIPISKYVVGNSWKSLERISCN